MLLSEIVYLRDHQDKGNRKKTEQEEYSRILDGMKSEVSKN